MRYSRPFLYDQNKNHEFQTLLKEKVYSYFSQSIKNQKATPLMWFKVVLYISLFWLNWYALVFFKHDLFLSVVLLMFFAFSSILIAFNISHDAVHHAISGNKKIDHFIYYLTFSFLGPNAYLWKIRHSNAHHYFVNIPGSDMDIESTRLLRVAPHIEWRTYHRFQHFYCIFLYAFFTLDWILIKDFKIYRMKSFGGVTDLKHPSWRWFELCIWKGIYLALMLFIPIHFLPYHWSIITLGFVGFHFFMSSLLLVLFAASHIAVESHYVIQEESGFIPHSFLEHQLLTSVDYHPRNKIFGFIYGGFNAHVAHHMFPNICSIHYPALSAIIKQTANQFGLPYQEKSFIGIIISHFKMMKVLGSDPERANSYIIKRMSENS